MKKLEYVKEGNFYKIKGTNKKGETLTIEITETYPDNTSKK